MGNYTSLTGKVKRLFGCPDSWLSRLLGAFSLGCLACFFFLSGPCVARLLWLLSGGAWRSWPCLVSASRSLISWGEGEGFTVTSEADRRIRQTQEGKGLRPKNRQVWSGTSSGDCALQACFEGVQSVAIGTVMSEIDIFISTTGNLIFSTLDHMKKLENNAFVGNIGHFDNEIDLAGSDTFSSSPLATV